MWLILFYLSFVIVIILQQKLQKTGLGAWRRLLLATFFFFTFMITQSNRIYGVVQSTMCLTYICKILDVSVPCSSNAADVSMGSVQNVWANGPVN